MHSSGTGLLWVSKNIPLVIHSTSLNTNHTPLLLFAHPYSDSSPHPISNSLHEEGRIIIYSKTMKSNLTSTTVTSNFVEVEDFPVLVAQRAKYGMLLDSSGNEFVVPDYTLKQIYEAIPKECFDRNVLKSLRYLFQDLALVTLTFLAFSKYNTSDNIPFTLVRFFLWGVYGFMQMLFGCGIW